MGVDKSCLINTSYPPPYHFQNLIRSFVACGPAELVGVRHGAWKLRFALRPCRCDDLRVRSDARALCSRLAAEAPELVQLYKSLVLELRQILVSGATQNKQIKINKYKHKNIKIKLYQVAFRGWPNGQFRGGTLRRQRCGPPEVIGARRHARCTQTSERPRRRESPRSTLRSRSKSKNKCVLCHVVCCVLCWFMACVW